MATCKEEQKCVHFEPALLLQPCRKRYGDEGCRHSQIYPHTGLNRDLGKCATSKCITEVDCNKNRPYISLHACERMNIIRKIVTSPYILRSLE